MNILHLSFDYPDSFNQDKTVAIKYLVQSTEEHISSTVISLNRVSKRNQQREELEDKNLYIINSFGFPKGILFKNMLERFWLKVDKILANYNKYDLLHAHKLTYEGYLAYKIYKKYNINFIITIRASDFKILKHKPNLVDIYRCILECSKKILVLSPWMKTKLEEYFGSDFINKIKSKIEFLPNFVECNEEYNGSNNGKYILVMKVTKRNIKIKNLKRTLKAISELKDKCEIKLDIIGDGPGIISLNKMISKYKIEENIKLLGRMENSEVLKSLSKYKGLIMCSYPETFGLVYIEALSKGIPIVYCKDSGVYGIFEDLQVGEFAEYSDIGSIKKAIISIEQNFDKYKKNVYNLQKNKGLDIFRKDNISKKYLEILGIREG